MDRPLTARERGVLDTLLAENFDGVEDLREQAKSVRVIGGCACGCPSIDFNKVASGLWPRVNARIDGRIDELFLFTDGRGVLAGIEYVPNSDDRPAELPHPSTLRIY